MCQEVNNDTQQILEHESNDTKDSNEIGVTEESLNESIQETV